MTDLPPAPSNFDDLDTFVRNHVAGATVERLKVLIDWLNARQRLSLKKSGRKSELVDRIHDVFRGFRVQNNLFAYQNARQEYFNIIMNRGNNPFGLTPPSVYGGSASPALSRTAPSAASAHGLNGASPAYRPSTPSQIGWRPPAYNTTTGSVPAARHSYEMLRWKASPMWKPLKALSDPIMIQSIDEGNTHEKKARTFSVQLQPADLTSLAAGASGSSPRRSIRLFCTSSDYYPASSANPMTAVPLEFPTHAELFVNQNAISFKKGLKGKANTAAPVNMDANGTTLKKVANILNTVAFSHQGPTINKKTKVSKKFYVQVCLTETWSTNDLLDRINKGVRRSYDSILQGLKTHAAEDEIQLGSSKLSLKCPLSYMRIKTPVRSTLCSHLQCFEVESWLQINEQTPQFQCPTCEKELGLDMLFIDGFFSAILGACSDEVEDVIVEADGEWHTEDGKLGSTGWLKQRAIKIISTPASVKSSPAPQPPSSRITPALPEIDRKPSESLLRDGTPRTDPNSRNQRIHEVFVLDDEDDTDEEEAPLRSSTVRTDQYHSASSLTPLETPRRTITPPVPHPAATAEPIDLTLDSDDDEPSALANAVAGPSRLPYQAPPPRQANEPGGGANAFSAYAGQSNGFALTSTGGTNGHAAGLTGGSTHSASNSRSDRLPEPMSDDELFYGRRTRARLPEEEDDDYDPLFPPKRPRLSAESSNAAKSTVPAGAARSVAHGTRDSVRDLPPSAGGPAPAPRQGGPTVTAGPGNTSIRITLNGGSSTPNRPSAGPSSQPPRPAIPNGVHPDDRDPLAPPSPPPRDSDRREIAPLPRWQPIVQAGRGSTPGSGPAGSGPVHPSLPPRPATGLGAPVPPANGWQRPLSSGSDRDRWQDPGARPASSTSDRARQRDPPPHMSDDPEW